MTKQHRATVDQLYKRSVYSGQVAILEKTWPADTILAKENILRALMMGLNVEWFVDNFLSALALKAYREAMMPIRKAYQKATVPALEAYDEIELLTWVAYKKAISLTWRAYQEAAMLSWKIYEEPITSVWRAYQEATMPAWRAYEEARELAWEACSQAHAQVLADACEETG